ncbi:hypothetical protein PINS_up010125 [Pythium insidiosum]|nr:hypothetical protein PINS_up010125 [Pythium insidiosum]
MISEEELQTKFTFGRLLGSGATSQVYAARDHATGQEVAIKVFDKAAMIEVRRSMAADGQFVTEKAVHRVRRRLLKVLSELEIAKSLDHPNIIKFLGAYETSHRICLVHELVDGCDLLEHLLTHGKMNETQAAGVFRQLLSALQYCHERNVCHRDLKLENVLLTKDLQVKLIDFGLSEVVPAGTTLRTICGTPLYCAPEVLFLHSSSRETGFQGAPADVWSVGILIFALLTGCAPFDDSSFAKLRHDVQRNRIAYPTYLSNEVKGMLKLMLVFDPVLRPSVADLLDYTWLQERPAAATSSTTTTAAAAASAVASPVSSPTSKRPRQRSLSGASENGTDTTASTSGSFDNDETAALRKITEEPQHRPEISLPTHLSCLERELEQLLTTAS